MWCTVLIHVSFYSFKKIEFKKYIRAVAHLLCIYTPTFNDSFFINPDTYSSITAILIRSLALYVQRSFFYPFSNAIEFRFSWPSLSIYIQWWSPFFLSFFILHHDLMSIFSYKDEGIYKTGSYKNRYNISYWWRPSNPSIILNCNDFDSYFNRIWHRRIDDNFIHQTFIYNRINSTHIQLFLFW